MLWGIILFCAAIAQGIGLRASIAAREKQPLMSGYAPKVLEPVSSINEFLYGQNFVEPRNSVPNPPVFEDPTFPVPSRGILDPIYAVPFGGAGILLWREGSGAGGSGASAAAPVAGSSSPPYSSSSPGNPNPTADLLKEWTFDPKKNSGYSSWTGALNNGRADDGGYGSGLHGGWGIYNREEALNPYVQDFSATGNFYNAPPPLPYPL